MAGTITIPQATLDPAHGPYTFGPAPAADADTRIVLAVNRDLPGGFNSLTPAATAEITAEQSSDGGATWFLAVGGTMTGGQYFRGPPPRGDGGLITVTTVRVDLYPGTGRRVRAVVTVNASVTVSGTLTIS